MDHRPTLTAARLKRPAKTRPQAAEVAPRPFRAPKIAELVADHIRKLIIRGELKPGDRLEPEARLIERFATSRATIREAVLMLEAEQFLVVQRGSRQGARVCLPSPDNPARHAGFVLQAEGATIGDIYHVRAAVEPYAVWLLARQRSPEVVARLRAELDVAESLQQAGREIEMQEALAQFHLTLVDLTGSASLKLMSAMIRDIIARHRERVFGVAQPHDACWGLKSFWKLVNLIERGEAQRAEAHWRLHIQTTVEGWIRDGGDESVVDLLD